MTEHEQEVGSGLIFTFEILIWTAPFGSVCRLLVMKSSFVEGMKMPASWAKGYEVFSESSSSFGLGPMMSRNDACKIRKGLLFCMMVRLWTQVVVDMVGGCIRGLNSV